MGCDNCADLGHTDDAGEVICPECNGTGNVTEQREADRELGRMIRAIYHTGVVLSMSTGVDGCPFIMVGGVLQQGRYRSLNEAVKAAGEGNDGRQ